MYLSPPSTGEERLLVYLLSASLLLHGIVLLVSNVDLRSSSERYESAEWEIEAELVADVGAAPAETALPDAKQAEEGIGPGGDKSIPAKLTFFFEAINKTPKNVDIKIQQIAITERSMKIKGDTNSSSGRRSLFDMIKKHSRISIRKG